MRRASSFDLAVVGGGTGGLVGALIAARIGARVLLVEQAAQTGGDCLWWGCVPSKSLLAAAELAHAMRNADRVGLEPVEPRIELARVMEHVDRARRTIEPQDSVARLRREGVQVVQGRARLIGPRALEVDGRAFRFRRALLATGSQPVLPPVEGLEGVAPLTNETVWELRELPARLVVLGGGPIGCELSQAFARLGSRVCLVELAPALLGQEEPEAQELVRERLEGEGVEVRLRTRARRAEAAGEGGVLVVEGEDGGEERLGFDRVLVAAGRRPSTDGLGLEAAGVQVDERGAVRVDATLRTSARGIFAAGDVTGMLPFTHVAGHHARVAVPNALFGTRRAFSTDAVPWVTFTDPEVARVGLSERQARERHGAKVAVARHDYADLDRAITAGRPHGFAKLVAGPRGRLVGATVAAPAGGEAIAELAAHVAAGRRIGDVSRTVHAYPTFAEGPARAADEHLATRLRESPLRHLAPPVLALLRALARG
jgi:pyruvate/2-oxoglutarate dehydrogenase complex dihydrolipoamide dehydrogenase (E3) component